MTPEPSTCLRMGRVTSFVCDSFRLYGVLHADEAAPRGTALGVVLINPGPTDRAGAHRLSIKLAERFARAGHPTMRFDPRGAGESEGDWSTDLIGKPILEVYDEVERGVWIPDTRAAIEHLIERTGVQRVVLGGVCGGAITALLAGADDPRVAGMFLIGNPVTRSLQTLTDVSKLPEKTLDDQARKYARKLLRPSAWLRMIRFKTDFRTLWGVLQTRVRRLVPGPGRGPARDESETMSSDFLRAFARAVKHRKRLLFVYSGNDYHWHEFQEYFLSTRPESSRHAMEVACIEDANHNLTEDRWQQALYGILTPWIERVNGKGDEARGDAA